MSQNWEMKGHNGHFEVVKSLNEKIATVLIPYKWKMSQKTGKGGKFIERKNGDFFFSVRSSDFSLKIRAIRPSAVFGTRRKAALRGEGFVWVPDLGSFLKLLEVVVSPYLGFTPSLSTLRMFESIEAVRGRLISPKPWNRINMKF